MATRHYGWAWAQPVGGTAKLVLLYLVEKADRADECWPSVDSIAEATGLGTATVKRHLAELVRAGLITRKHRHSRVNGHRISDLITVLGITVSSRPRDHHGGPRDHHGGPRDHHDPAVLTVTEPVTEPARSEDDIRKVREGIQRHTGKPVTDEWAARVIRHALNGHQPHNIAAYVLAAVKNNPANFLPTPTPPRA